jgi:hypothetical protein
MCNCNDAGRKLTDNQPNNWSKQEHLKANNYQLGG